MDDLIPIGQFSALTWLSPKALRIYQAQGLLEPTWVDPGSGYRYYAPAQIPVATRIGHLRRAGISLVEIAAFLAAPTRQRVDAWRAALDAEVAARRDLLDHIAEIDDDMPEAPAVTDDPTIPTMQRAVPVLVSLDLEATQRFYSEKLGFEAPFRYPDYAICSRDGVQIHFSLTDDADRPKATSCRVDVVGVDRLYDEMSAAGVVHPNGPLTDRPWGFREFAVLDGDGNLITFGERTA